MAHFKNKTIKGQVYDLSHLEPFNFEIDTQEKKVSVRVEFSCHCFTETLDSKHTPDLKYTHNQETRAFDPERYRLSLKLPELIQTLGNQSVYHTEQGNFFTLRDQTLDGGKTPYLVFFRSYKSTDKKIDVRIYIQSAYLKPNMSRWGSPIKFSTLLLFTKEGKKLPLGPKKQIKRA